jgi:glutamate racemase
MDRRIGVFDSGVGGLTVLKELVKKMPNEKYFYLGDTANVPYGVRESEDIARLSVDAYKKLENLGIKMLVIACNTATVHGLEAIKKVATVPVIGVIEPGVRAALDSGIENVLVLATNATVNSGLIQNMLKDSKPDINVEGIGAPEMVLAVEEGHSNDEIGEKIVNNYLDSAEINPDGVMLSCTHFPALEHFVVDYYKKKGKDICIINPAKNCAEETFDILDGKGELRKTGECDIDFYATGDIDKFIYSGNMVLGGDIIIEEAKNL